MLRFFVISEVFGILSNCFIPPRSAFLERILFIIRVVIFNSCLRGDNKSVSLFENKQFFILPSAVNLILLHVLQNGLVTELITPKVPN